MADFTLFTRFSIKPCLLCASPRAGLNFMQSSWLYIPFSYTCQQGSLPTRATTPDSLSQRRLVMGWPILLERTLRAVTRVAVLLSGTMQKVQNLLKTSHATTIWAKKEVELVLVFLAPGWDLNVIEGIRSICTDPEPPFFGITRSTCALPGSLGSVSCLCFLQDRHPDLTSFRILFAPRIWTQLLYFNIVLMRPKCVPDALLLYGKCPFA